ncbi:MAG TPA: hypothetical protein VFR02_10090 [bacterium]|nr:hypothetical protein [bacterium]
MALTKEIGSKELWHHFKPSEMEMIAACAYGTWLKMPAMNEEKLRTTPTNWTPYEMVMLAIEKLDLYFKSHAHEGLDWKIATVEPGFRRVSSGNFQLTNEENAKSREVWEALFGKKGHGTDWGDAKYLQSLVDGAPGRLLKSFFGDPMSRPRFASFERTNEYISSQSPLEDLLKKQGGKKPEPAGNPEDPKPSGSKAT